jgi:hypothetical protein
MVPLCRLDGSGEGDGGSADSAAGADTTAVHLYFIHGRNDADIIKTDGKDASALELERELLSL